MISFFDRLTPQLQERFIAVENGVVNYFEQQALHGKADRLRLAVMEPEVARIALMEVVRQLVEEPRTVSTDTIDDALKEMLGTEFFIRMREAFSGVPAPEKSTLPYSFNAQVAQVQQVPEMAQQQAYHSVGSAQVPSSTIVDQAAQAVEKVQEKIGPAHAGEYGRGNDGKIKVTPPGFQGNR